MPNRKAVINDAISLDLSASDGMTDTAIRIESDEERFFQEYTKYALEQLADEERQYLLHGWSPFGDKLSEDELIHLVKELDIPLTDDEFDHLQTLAGTRRPDLVSAVRLSGANRIM